ncbi:hypothetical protein [Methanobacterium formicicum]|uniref:Uncharacterized protein n=1 Tax=Methanobacterium formicicum (strain DSM 3637 / PP1) TaxID=1204725 RepID=K2RT84_METFP|nr:hypothetical protein [Methanobacterium formicicum]EKF85970.1 hypothetical protein A994_05771 [Methanobacterium formicicum DSM 3637]
MTPGKLEKTKEEAKMLDKNALLGNTILKYHSILKYPTILNYVYYLNGKDKFKTKIVEFQLENTPLQTI